MSRILCPLAAVGLVLASAGPASATTARLASPEQLVRASHVVVVAAAESAETAFEGTRIVTRYKVRVEESWMGALLPGHRLNVVTLGGAVGDIGQHVAGAARMTIGKRAVLYLVRDAKGDYHATGMWQGVFHVADDPDGAVARSDTGVRIVGPQIVPFPGTLDALRRSVRESEAVRAR